MDPVAIDLGGKESQICRRQSDGRIVEERRVATASVSLYLKRLAPSRVIVETCSESFAIADAARQQGHDVRVVPATLAPSLGVGARGIKTDVRDARALSEASCRMDLPSVHVPSVLSRERKAMCGMREALVGARTMLINTVRGWLRAEAVRLSRGGTDNFTERVWAYAAKAQRELPTYVQRQLASIDQLCAQIAQADQELVTMAKSEPTCRNLMTMPGVGPVNAVLFVAVLDEIGRFPDAASVGSYLGLTPGERSSSSKVRRTGITKAGAPRMRRILVQAAHAARLSRKEHPMVTWSREVEERRGRRVAVIALARKMAGILYAMWRDGTPYNASRGAAPAPAPTAAEAGAEAAREAAMGLLAKTPS